MSMEREDFKPWAYVHDGRDLYEVVETVGTMVRLQDSRTDQIRSVGLNNATATLTLVRPGVDPATVQPEITNIRQAA